MGASYRFRNLLGNGKAIAIENPKALRHSKAAGVNAITQFKFAGPPHTPEWSRVDSTVVVF
jgi:hypothetical protein